MHRDKVTELLLVIRQSTGSRLGAMAVMIGLIPVVFGVFTWAVVSDVHFFYEFKNLTLAGAAAFCVLGCGLRDCYKLFYSGKEADPPLVFLRRVVRSYVVVLVVVGVIYVLCHLYDFESAWPALPIGIATFVWIRGRLRSPVIEEQVRRSRPA